MTASRQWANRPNDERFETLDALYAAVHARHMQSRSADIAPNQIRAEASGDDIVIAHGTKLASPTNWSFGQFSGLLKAPASYVRTLPATLACDCINHGISVAQRDALKFWTYVNPDTGAVKLSAVTSTTYGRIYDDSCVEECRKIVTSTGGKFFNPKAYVNGEIRPSGLYASDRDVFMFLIDGGSQLDIGPRAQLNRGFFMWNSEVGSRTFGLMTFLFNSVCGNHIVWGAQDVRELKIRHTVNGPYRFNEEATPALVAYANASAVPLVSSIKRAQDYLLPATNREEVIVWLMDHKFTKADASGSYDQAKIEEGECRTLWQAVQGATAYARGFDYVDTRVALETTAGKLLDLVK